MKNALLAIVLFTLPTLCAWPAATPVPQGPPPGVKAWWPGFLGPNRDGMIADKGINTDWKKSPPKTLWKVPLGSGFSSFAIVGDKVFTMTKREKRDIAVCLDANTGKELWTCDLAPNYMDQQKQGAGPRSTPTYHD